MKFLLSVPRSFFETGWDEEFREVETRIASSNPEACASRQANAVLLAHIPLYGIWTDERGINLTVSPPDHPVSAILGGSLTVTKKLEFVRNVETESLDPDAAAGNIGHKTAAAVLSERNSRQAALRVLP